MANNVWLNSFGKRIASILTQLEEQRLRSQHSGSLNYSELTTILKGAQNEIARQYSEIKALNTMIEELENAIKKQDDAAKKLNEAVKDTAPYTSTKELIKKKLNRKK